MKENNDTMFKTFLRLHWPAIVVATLIAVIVAAPPYLWRHSPEYQGVDMLKTNTEAHYVTQVQEVYDGHAGIGNPFFAGEKDSLYVFPPLSPNIIASVGMLAHVSAIDAVMITRFLCIFFLAFFIYLCGFELSGSRLVGLVAAPGVILAYNLVDPTHILELLRGQMWTQEKTFIDYGRPVNPQLSSLFFFSYLYFLLRSLKSGSKKCIVAATLLLGASFYVYLFTWTFILSLNGSIILFSLLRKDREMAKRVFGIMLGGILLGIPYFFHTWAIMQHPWYAETAVRFGFVHTRALNMSRTVVLVALVFVAVYKKSSRFQQMFFSSFFVTAFFVANEQLITNQYVFNHHYHWYYTTPLLLIFLSYVLFSVFCRHAPRRVRIIVATVVIAVCVASGIQTQMVSYASAVSESRLEQRYAPLFAWLSAEEHKDAAVFAPHPLSAMVPAYTHANVYYGGTAIYTLAPNERFLRTYAFYQYLRGIPQSEFRAYAEAHRDEITGFVYGYTYSFQPGVCTGCFPDSVIDDLTNFYMSVNDKNFVSLLNRYPVDYIVWDTKNDPSWKIDRFGLPLVWEASGIRVYRITTSSAQR